MLKMLVVLVVLCALVIVYYGVSVSKRLEISKRLVEEAKPFERTEAQEARSLLVVGDSTAVGVGASEPSESLAALLAAAQNINHVENYAFSGARTADLLAQIKKAKRSFYDVILVQVGANDILRFLSTKKASMQLREALNDLPSHDKLIVLTAGNVGGAPILPHPVRPIYERLNLKYHDTFEKVVSEAEGTYVNLYEKPKDDPFVQQPDVYFADDFFHPSSAGYRLWFEEIKTVLNL